MSTTIHTYWSCSADGCHASENGPGEFKPEGWTDLQNRGQFCPHHRPYVICEYHHATCLPGFGHYETSECVNPTPSSP